jgi:hypothetical protein
MRITRTLFLSGALFAAISLGAVSIDRQQERNLKVLPKDISDEELDKIMDSYADALGVKCAYCHAPSKSDPQQLDFASDAKAAKKIAREMMLMTIEINKQFFKDHTDANGKVADAISCISCHNGEEYPAVAK